MDTYFETLADLYGSAEEIAAMTDVFCSYTKKDEEKPVWLLTVKINGRDARDIREGIKLCIRNLTEQGKKVMLSAIGPFGGDIGICRTDIFRKMAEAAPCASFVAVIQGSTLYCEERHECVFKDGVLDIRAKYTDTTRPEAQRQRISEQKKIKIAEANMLDNILG